MNSRKLLFFTVLSGLFILLSFTYNRTIHTVGKTSSLDNGQRLSRQEIYKNRSIRLCSPDWSAINMDSLVATIFILPGWGSYQWPIRSDSDSARLYFQQGISMYYSFHIIESMASFKKAATFDDQNAMIYWAQGLANGPNINDFETKILPEAITLSQKAMALAGNCTPKEKALIAAMATRYAADSSMKISVRNEQYTAAMKKAHEAFPKDGDVAALYADAMMLEHPWMYWKHDGEPYPWTNHLVDVLEDALERTPNHPGANHYYIHCTEASPNSMRALKSADRLSELLPSVSHMVHMPSHIYIRNGFYAKGMKVNEMSISGYESYKKLFPAVEQNFPLYLVHNLHMQAACGMLGAGYQYSASSALATRGSFDSSMMSIGMPFAGFIQYVYMTPVFNQVRYGKWDSVIANQVLSTDYKYASLLEHWAKGLAKARLKQIKSAERELKYVQENMVHPDLQIVLQPFNAPVDGARVAEKMLQGFIAEASGDFPAAIKAFEQAVVFEDAMIYNEPKDWILPVRPYLGAVLIKAGQFAAAEKIFRQDLKDNPNNHWALKGLHTALQKQGKKQEAVTSKKALDKSLQLTGEKDFPIVY
ncbi:MAG: hypothetical protein V4725_00075 [Bacteroidota bacterium]